MIKIKLPNNSKNCLTKDIQPKKQLKKLHMELYINQNLICQTTYLEMERLQSINQTILQKDRSIYQQFEAQTTQTTTQINLISQYLELSRSVSEQRQQQISKNYSQGQNSSHQKKADRSWVENQGQITKECKKTSLFHNFQKHLITTLKSIIKLKAMPHHKKSYLSIAHDMWDYFCQANKSSKRFLNCLLGKKNADINPSRLKQQTCKDCQKLNEYLSQYSKEEIQVAQDHLCKEIIRKSLRLLQLDQLKIRRIKNHEGFKSYFINFVEELQNGQLSKRLPKNIKVKIIKNEELTQPTEANIAHLL